MKKRKGQGGFHKTMQCKGHRGYNSQEEANAAANNEWNKQAVRCRIADCGKYHVINEWPQDALARAFRDAKAKDMAGARL